MVFTDHLGVEDAPVIVNDTLTGVQESASVAITGDGEFVVVWTSDHEGDSGVYAKVFNSDGDVKVNEFRIDAGNGSNASVDIDNGGNFVVAWEEAAVDADGDIFIQAFELDGDTIGSKQLVNNLNSAGIQGNPDVAINNSGDVVVTWDNFD